MFSLSGETGWVEKKIPVKEGYSEIEWTYKKDGNTVSGSDCAWIDFVSFPASSFSRFDLKTIAVLSPVIKDIYGNETVSARIKNLGMDTLRSFNMAYSVNGTVSAIENFANGLNPGDSTDISFEAKAELFRNGSYSIDVFGMNSSDGYLLNDTASISVTNNILPITDRVMPNPFASLTKVQFYSDDTEDVTLTVYDSKGRKVLERKESVTGGNNEITVNCEALGAGYYTLKIKGSISEKVFKLLKKE
jgi:hypothetical protein